MNEFLNLAFLNFVSKMKIKPNGENRLFALSLVNRHHMNKKRDMPGDEARREGQLFAKMLDIYLSKVMLVYP